jgi:3-oxocholest-4-en-26-oate---CoA ligase
MRWNMAAMWDLVAAAVPDAPALIHSGQVTRWAEYEQRAASLAAAFFANGLTPGGRVAILAYNSSAWIEAQYAAFKARGVAVNVNYRYTAHELQHILDDSDAEVVVVDRQLSTLLAEVAPSLQGLKYVVAIEDGSGAALAIGEPFEDAISAHAPLSPLDYSEDDIHMLYTGGTTGLPKGVVYRQGDMTRLLAAGFAAYNHASPASEQDYISAVQAIRNDGLAPVALPACPLMHGAGSAMGIVMPHILGGATVTLRNEHFDADELWRAVERHRITDVSIVGDAFAKPMVSALEKAATAGTPFDISSLKRLRSSGVAFSQETKDALLRFADIVISDFIAASEGSMGASISSRQAAPSSTGGFVFNPGTKVFNDQDEEIPPGSDEIGRIATSGIVPLRYQKDEAKSAATFRTIRGVRYSIPGDFAKVAQDGSLILLGRGSSCINTGGEKVFPEEVEEVLKRHPSVFDCLVVGAPDERYGQRVVALLSLEGPEPDRAELGVFCRKYLAGYKVPREFIIVPEVVRGPNGKADYRWAKLLAAEHQPLVS